MTLILYVCILSHVTGLIEFDCGGHELNITTLSLPNIDDCELAEIETNTIESYV